MDIFQVIFQLFFGGGYQFRKTLSKVVKDNNFSSMPNNHDLIVQEQLS